MVYATWFYLVKLFLIFVSTRGQDQIGDQCALDNGNIGECVLYENCPGAIEMICNRRGIPVKCGFQGRQPIVCCEPTKPKAALKRRKVGEISVSKCRETYQNLLPTTTKAPITSSTTPLPDDLSFEDLRALLAKEEEEKRKAGISTNVQSVAVGGVNAKAAEFLHMAILGYGDFGEIAWGCGGSLISEKFVMTAAHCINTQYGVVKHVRLGELNLNITTDNARPQDFEVARTFIHPNYRGPIVYNDIALVELSRNARFDDFVRPGCLFTEADIPDQSLSATGWGLTSFQGVQADHLQEVTLRQFSLEDCQKSYASTPKRQLPNGIDSSTQVCAGEEFRDTCQGDSGGPLQIKNSEFATGYKIIGITSVGKACGLSTGPSVYTRVSHYIEWIESIVWP